MSLKYNEYIRIKVLVDCVTQAAINLRSASVRSDEAKAQLEDYLQSLKDTEQENADVD